LIFGLKTVTLENISLAAYARTSVLAQVEDLQVEMENILVLQHMADEEGRSKWKSSRPRRFHLDEGGISFNMSIITHGAGK
jgi:hypothetical protein